MIALDDMITGKTIPQKETKLPIRERKLNILVVKFPKCYRGLSRNGQYTST